MRIILRYFLIALFGTTLLSACGGSGGNSSEGGDSSVSVSLNKSSINFSASLNGALPANQQVVTTFKGEGVLVGFPTGASDPGWVTADYAAPPTATTTTFNVQITTTNLSAGTHTATLRFLTGDTASQQSDYKDLLVTFVVSNELAVQQTNLSFNTVLGNVNSLFSQTINVSGEGISWTASSDQSWAILNQTGGTGTANLQLAIDETGLGVGTYFASVTVTNTANNLSEVVEIRLIIEAPAFQLQSVLLEYSGINGKSLASKTFDVRLNNGMTTNWSLVASDNWLDPNITAGTTQQSVQLDIDAQTSNLSSGSYTGTLTFSANVLGHDVTEVVNVNLDLRTMTFRTLPTPFLVSGINGSDLGTRQISFALDTDVYDHTWNLSSNDSWLLVSSNSGTNSGSVNVSFDASTLASGDYTGSLTLSGLVNGDIITENINIALSLTQATLTLSASELTFAGVNGADLGTKTLDISINTGGVIHPWSIALDSGTGFNWLQSDINNGSASATLQTVTFSSNETGLLGNVYPGSATVTVSVNGDTLTQLVPVNLRLDPQKLSIADNGVLLSSFPSVSTQLSHTVTVYDNASLNSVNWSASSDQAWLNVTSSGITGTGLVITANPTGLLQDVLHTAVVTLTSADAAIENSGNETIRVGLYMSSTEPAAQATVPFTDPAKLTGLVTDPVRPYVYVSHGGTDIDIYNVYSGSLVNTLANIGGDLRYLTISSDGTTLYAVDHSDYTILPIDLATSNPSAKFNTVNLPSCTICSEQWLLLGIDYTRINGYPVLITAGSQIVDAADGTVLASFTNPDNLPFSYRYAPYIRTSSNGEIAVAMDMDASPFDMARFSLSYSSLETGSFSGVMTHREVGSGNARDLAIDETGSRVYTSSGSGCTGYDFCYYAGDDLSYVANLAGDAYPVAVEMSPDGRVYGGSELSMGIDIWRFDNTSLLSDASFNIADSLNKRQLVISGDSSILVTRTRPSGSSTQNFLQFTRIVP